MDLKFATPVSTNPNKTADFRLAAEARLALNIVKQRRIPLPVFSLLIQRMSAEPNASDDWNSCPSGLISQTAEHHLETPVGQTKRHRSIMLSWTVLIVMLVLLLSYSFIEAQPVTPNSDTALNCQTVKANLNSFCNDQIQDVSLERAIGKHLIDCKPCREMYRSTCGCSHKCPNRKRKVVTKPCYKK